MVRKTDVCEGRRVSGEGPRCDRGMRLRGSGPKGGIQERLPRQLPAVGQTVVRQFLVGTNRLGGRWGRIEAVGTADRHRREREVTTPPPISSVVPTPPQDAKGQKQHLCTEGHTLPLTHQKRFPPGVWDKQCTLFIPENPNQCLHPEVLSATLTQPLWETPGCPGVSVAAPMWGPGLCRTEFSTPSVTMSVAAACTLPPPPTPMCALCTVSHSAAQPLDSGGALNTASAVHPPRGLRPA